MRLLEKISTNLRHSQWLGKYQYLWDFVRPVYNSFISQYGKNGLERIINGTDTILVSPKFRGVGESYEPEVWHHLMSHIKDGDKIVDIGAYIGLYAIAMGNRVGLSGKVFAFEPDPINFQDLQQHIRLNQVELKVHPIEAAVGEKDTTVYFQSGRDSQSSIQVSSAQGSVSVNCVSIDKYFDGEKIDILKIDVEGYEEFVLKGATHLLKDNHRSPRVMYIEVHPFAWPKSGTSWDSLLTFLSQHNYDVSTLDGSPVKNIDWWGEIIAYRKD